MRYRFARSVRTRAPDCGMGSGRAVAAFLIVEQCSTDERIGQVRVTHIKLGCTQGWARDTMEPGQMTS